MADYLALRDLFNHADLRNKVEMACIIAAETIRTEDPATANHTERLAWAKRAFENPATVRDKMLMAVIAANNTQDIATIIGASDAAFQSNVDDAVAVFAVEG